MIHIKKYLEHNSKYIFFFPQVTGPVDLDQIHLENVEMQEVIMDKNAEITTRRKSIAMARARKTKLQEILKQEDKRTVELIKMNT